MWKAAAMMFVAMSLIPAGDTAGKLMTGGLGTAAGFVAWSRFVIGALALAPAAPPGSLRLLADWRIWLRALSLVMGILSILTALSTTPIADVFAAFFIGPVISYVLSALLLREPITVLRSLLLAIGFAGVMLVVRPGFGMTPGLGFALLAGCFYGAYLTASRWLAPVAPPRALMFSQLVIGAIATAPLAAVFWPPFSWSLAGLVIASGLCSMLGNLMLTTAYRNAPASRLAPFVYFQLFAATFLGWAVFGDLPGVLTWAGLALIAGSGLASAWLPGAAAMPEASRPQRG